MWPPWPSPGEVCWVRDLNRGFRNSLGSITKRLDLLLKTKDMRVWGAQNGVEEGGIQRPWEKGREQAMLADRARQREKRKESQA